MPNLAPGDYIFTVSNGSCTSAPSVNVHINAAPGIPAAPTVGTITHPTCTTATGSVVLNNLPSSGIWVITGGPVPVVGAGTSTTISGLAAGTTYTFTVTNSGECISVASAPVVINAAPTPPSAPLVGTITQPDCTVATGSVVLNGLPALSWTINPGNISGTGSSTTIPGLAPGDYTYTVSNGVCASAPSINIHINAAPAVPAAPTVGTITHPTCTTATGSVVLNNLPSSGIWVITGGPASVFGTGTSTTIPGLAAGTTYTFTVTNAAGCTSLASANVVINAAPAPPSAPLVGVITQPDCSVATGSVVLNGLPAGSWTINPGNILGSTSSTTVSGLAPGTHTFMVTNAAGCTSPASGPVLINAVPDTAVSATRRNDHTTGLRG